MSFYSKAKFLLAGLIRKLWRVQVIGKENERPDKTYIICANHMSMIDPIVIGAAIQHNPKYMAKAELMRIPLLNLLFKALGAYSVDRKGSDVAAIKKTINMLKEGESIMMFPQGTRHKGVDPKTTKVKFGCSMIAHKAEVGVLPIYIKVKNHKVKLFRRTVIIIGKEITFEELKAISGGDDHKKSAEYIFSKITELGDVA
ncbi:MAG: 1-acyl-sn-glycerol-3-phosphate acyltransferase [Ruminococcaceae bacterium]|nr:1-acyl-sn-glycerol-3-phosphate acyltransferase [Oscillospiraceae bacterium]